MFIQTESTPNPSSLKFLPGREVLAGGGADFADPDAALASPLASAVFAIDGVAGVFLGEDFVTVTKAAGREWPHLKPAILAAIMDFFVSGAPVMRAGVNMSLSTGESEVVYDADTAEIVAEIKAVLESRVRPTVAADGGDIIFQRFERDEGVVFLTLRGSCSGCPSSTITLKNGIETLLKHYVPEVTRVEAAA